MIKEVYKVDPPVFKIVDGKKYLTTECKSVDGQLMYTWVEVDTIPNNAIRFMQVGC